jgi:hypothetical protein
MLETPSFKLSKDLAETVSNFRKELSSLYDSPEFVKRVQKMAGWRDKSVILQRAEDIANKELIPVSQSYRTPRTGNVMGYYANPDLFRYTEATGKALSDAEILASKASSHFNIPSWAQDISKYVEIDDFKNPNLGSSYVNMHKKLLPNVPRNLEDVKKLFTKGAPKKINKSSWDLSNKSLLVHELEGHGLTMADKLLPKEFKNFAKAISDDAVKLVNKNSKSTVKYLFDASEVRARMSQMRELRKNLTGKGWYDNFTKEDYNLLLNSGKEIDPDFYKLLKASGNESKFIDMLNKMFVPAAATAVGAGAALDKKRLGGVLYKRGGKLFLNRLLKEKV